MPIGQVPGWQIPGWQIPDRRSRGFALLIVLWTVALLALLGTHITAAARQAAALSLLLHGAARAEALADGLVQEAVFRLLDPSPHGWTADGVARQVRLGGGAGEVVVLDHAGRVNPSLASPQLLAALLRRDGVEEGRAARLAAAIVDWHTIEDTPSPGGAKLPQYRAAGLPYGPPNEAFRSPGELALVLGMTPELLARLEPHLSVWSRGRIRLDRADPVVAQAVQDARDTPGGEAPPPPPNEAAPLVAEIVARVVLPEARTERHVVVRIDPPGVETALPWHILAWR